MLEPANIQYLPLEVLLPIIAQSEETQCCLINLLSWGSLKCGELHSSTTVIYTRGDRDQNGNYSRGSIEPVIPFNQADDLSVELQRWHLTKRVNVMDIANEEDICKEAQHILKEYRSEDEAYDLNDDFHSYHVSIEDALKLWDKRIFDTIPLANDNGSGDIKLETGNGAYTNRLRPESPQLACEKIRQLMIRPVCNYWAKTKQIVMDELQGQARKHNSAVALSCAVASNYRFATRFMLGLDWHLLKNLEVLCLDLTLVNPHSGYIAMEKNLVDMGRHLNLKTLILLGVSGLPRYYDKVEEDWVAAFEDGGHDRETRFRPRGSGLLKPSLISVLKETLRPGGQIHFINWVEPGTWSLLSEEERELTNQDAKDQWMRNR